MSKTMRVLVAFASGLGVVAFSVLMAALTRWLDTFLAGRMLLSIAMVAIFMAVVIWVYESTERRD